MSSPFDDYVHLTLIHDGKNSRVYKARKTEQSPWVALKAPATFHPSGHVLFNLGREYRFLCDVLKDIRDIPQAVSFVDQGNFAFIEMSYYPFRSLRDEAQSTPFGTLEVVTLFRHLAWVLAQLHQQNVIHKDINPFNILVDRVSMRVTLIDFGSADEVPMSPAPLTAEDYVHGTYAYIAPEQTGRLHRAVDYRSDLYSLGVSLFETLAGELPFSTIDVAELIHAHVAIVPPLLSSVQPDIPAVLSNIVARCLAKDPSDRYQSAVGLYLDLDRCVSEMQKGSTVLSFPLGERDESSQLLFPQKLYGRESELETLKHHYELAQSGQCAMALVAGESGVGKTALIREFNRVISADLGYITSGKYDQYNRGQPYSALVQAFSGLVQQILAESAEAVAHWQQRIRACLGINVGLMAELIPALVPLLGEIPPRQTLSLEQTRTLVLQLFLNLTQTLGSYERPILVFLDDLQWIDDASLELIEQFGTLHQSSQLFFVGAYRSNEVSAHHPLRQTIKTLKEKGVYLSELALQPLEPFAQQAFLMDLLHSDAQRIMPLNQLLFEKTHGNPLFLRTLISELYEAGDIRFVGTQLTDLDDNGDVTLSSAASTQGGWVWDWGAIQARPYADNVVDAIQQRLNLLPDACQSLLQLAAAIGGSFSIDMVSQLAQLPFDDVVNQLKPALNLSLIHILECEVVSSYGSSNKSQLFRYRFSHDRVQQAAYCLMSASEHPNLHLKIGRILLENRPSAAHDNKIGTSVFELASHFEKANDALLQESEEEQYAVAALVLKAGQQAKAATAFTEAARMLAFGCRLTQSSRLIQFNSWKEHYALTRDLHLDYAESLILTAQYDDVERLYGVISQYLEGKDDQLRLLRLKTSQFHAQARHNEAIQVELLALDRLGIHLPLEEGTQLSLFEDECKQITQALAGESPETLLHRPENNDAHYRMALEFLFSAFVDGYLMGQSQLCYTASAIMARLAMNEGNNPMSSVAYVNFSSSLCSLGEHYSLGYGFGQLAVDLANHYSEPALQNYTYHVFALGVNHWRNPVAESHGHWLRASKLALASGSPYAGYVFLQLPHCLFVSGAVLPEVNEQVDASSTFMAEHNLIPPQTLLSLLVKQPLKHLLGQTNHIKTLDDDEFSSASLIDYFSDAPFLQASLYYSLLRLNALTLQVLKPEVLKKQVDLIEKTNQGQIIIPLSWFFYGLCMAQSFRVGKISAEAFNQEKEQLLPRMAEWAELSPLNFLHFFNLLQAELLSPTELSFQDRIKAYEQSLNGALNQEYFWAAGLAAERIGLFWLREQQAIPAGAYFEQARTLYSRWGATGMVEYIESEYSTYLSYSASERSIDSVSMKDTSSEYGRLSDTLDVMAVVKSMQAISQHINRDKLAQELVALAMQNAGADRCLLIALRNGEDLVIQAELSHVMPSEWATPKRFSETAVMYALRTGKQLTINHNSDDALMDQCPYLLQEKWAAICCLPVQRQDNVTHVLYLEHHSLPNVFDFSRVQLLQILATQATISFENANAYQALASMNETLEKRVAERTKELEQKNKELHILSATDQLTGLNNRRSIEQQAVHEMDRSLRSHRQFALVIFDIDHFKRINDTFGHNIGDDVLKTVAKIVKETIRKTDYCGRWGGEEFIVLITDIEGSVKWVAEKLRIALEEHDHPTVGQVTASFGVALFQPDDSLSSLVKRADDALYEAKKGGRNRVLVAE